MRDVEIEDYLYDVKNKNNGADYSYNVRLGTNCFILTINKTVDKITKEVFIGPMTPVKEGWNDLYYVDFVKSDVRVLIHFFI